MSAPRTADDVPDVLAIGATDPWNAAGLGLDVRAIAACGGRALTVVAGVTAQDAGGLRAARAVAADLIAAQFASLARAEIAAVRIGALLDPASVAAVAAWLRGRHEAGRGVPVVYDPVLGPSGGGAFADDATTAAIVADLVPLVSLALPNLAEVARLTGSREPASPQAMAHAGERLRARGATAVLVTGGHLAGDPVDVLVAAEGTRTFAGARIAGGLRGTGCLLACAIAVALARGRPLAEAVETGRAFVRERFAGAREIAGMRVAY